MPSRKPATIQKAASSKGRISVRDTSISKKPRRISEPCSDEVEEKASNCSNPAFAIRMRPSHVIRGFWLNLPNAFCKKHLPLKARDGKKGVNVILKDDILKEYIVKYLPHRNGLSGGWREFAIAHSLAVGNELVFELIDQYTFKVLIMKPDGNSQNMYRIDGPSTDVSEMNPHFLDIQSIQPHWRENAEKSKEMKIAFEDFKIIVDDLDISFQIPSDIRRKYYNLCIAQKEYLHCNLSIADKQNLEPIIEMITETVKIYEEMKVIDCTTPIKCLLNWTKTLGSFEDQGMWVGFLRSYISRIIYNLGKTMKLYQTKLKEKEKLEEQRKKLETEVTNGKAAVKILDDALKELADVPW